MGGGGGDEDTRRYTEKCTTQFRFQRSWMILVKLFCNVPTSQLKAWKISFERQPWPWPTSHLCFAFMWSSSMEVYSVKYTTLGPVSSSQPLSELLSEQKSPLRNQETRVQMSLQTFHYRKLLSILKGLFLSWRDEKNSVCLPCWKWIILCRGIKQCKLTSINISLGSRHERTPDMHTRQDVHTSAFNLSPRHISRIQVLPIYL